MSTVTMEFDAEGAHRFHTEHQRLKDAVVEVVKACLAYDKAHIAPCGRVYSSSDLWSAVDALIEFEAEHKIGE